MSLTPRIDKIDKNYFINGAFDFAQRIGTTSSNTTSSSAYYLDRWGSYYGSNGSAATLARGSQTPDPRYPHCIDYDFNADNSSAFLGLLQRIESVVAQDLVGSPVSVSFMVNSQSATRARLQVFVNRTLDNTGAAVNEYDQSLTIPADSAWHLIKFENISLSSFVSLGCTFNFLFDQQSVIGTPENLFVTMMNLNIGSTASQFTRFAHSYVDELTACERYYEKSYQVDKVPGNTDGAQPGLCVQTTYNQTIGTAPGDFNKIYFRVRKRTTPTVIFYSAFTGAANTLGDQGGANLGLHSGDPGDAGETGCQPRNNTGGNLSPGERILFHYSADAEL